MKPLLPLISFLVFFAVFVPRAFADSSLEVSDRSDFSRIVRDFGGGQTIFIRIDASGAANLDGRLNLRDNSYNLVNSFSLSRDGNYFATIIPAPYGSGYYSLEAVIVGKGTNITSVKTIKVGNVSGASVRVNINSQVEGERISSQNGQGQQSNQSSPAPDLTSPSPDAAVESPIPDEVKEPGSEQNIFSSIGDFFKKIWRFVFR